jgi:hypothetical protein
MRNAWILLVSAVMAVAGSACKSSYTVATSIPIVSMPFKVGRLIMNYPSCTLMEKRLGIHLPRSERSQTVTISESGQTMALEIGEILHRVARSSMGLLFKKVSVIQSEGQYKDHDMILKLGFGDTSFESSGGESATKRTVKTALSGLLLEPGRGARRQELSAIGESESLGRMCWSDGRAAELMKDSRAEVATLLFTFSISNALNEVKDQITQSCKRQLREKILGNHRRSTGSD